MGKQPGAIYLASYGKGREVEVRITDKSKMHSINDSGGFRNNVCRQVKDAFSAADPANAPTRIEWEDLKLTLLRRD